MSPRSSARSDRPWGFIQGLRTTGRVAIRTPLSHSVVCETGDPSANCLSSPAVRTPRAPSQLHSQSFPPPPAEPSLSPSLSLSTPDPTAAQTPTRHESTHLPL